jgi:hypothetical protein
MSEPNQEYFLEPRLKGDRFDNHSVPVDILQDFGALQDLLIELAKEAYLLQNKRKRVPKGFAKGISINLQKVDEGSAWLKFVLAFNIATTSIALKGSNTLSYFETAKSKIIEVIKVAQDGGNVKDVLDKKYLNYFDRIGRNLLEGETVELNPSSIRPAVLTKKTRNFILLSASENETYVDNFSFNAKLSGIEKSDKSFSFINKGSKITASISRDYQEILANGFADPFSDSYVFVEGEAVYNGQGKIVSVNSISTLEPLDPLDVSIRIEQLSELREGWYNGDGHIVNPQGLARFEKLFYENWTFEQSFPAIFPTIEGNIQLEWTINKFEISIELDLITFHGEYLMVNVDDYDNIDSLIMDLSISENWSILNQNLKAANA